MAKKRKAGRKARKDVDTQKMGAWDLLKAGAIVAVIVIIAKVMLDLVSGLASFLRQALGKAWGIFKTNAVIFVAIPLALGFLAVTFPGSAEMLEELTGSLRKHLEMSGLQIRIPGLSSPSEALQPAGLAEASELRGCTVTMRYASTSRDGEQMCIDLCRDRGYTSYGLVRDGGSYECYCCHGSGTMITR